MTEDAPKAPAGWYPQGDGGERYWDGAAWTDQRRGLEPPVPEPTKTSVAPPSATGSPSARQIAFAVGGAAVLLAIVVVGAKVQMSDSSGDPSSGTPRAAVQTTASATSYPSIAPAYPVTPTAEPVPGAHLSITCRAGGQEYTVSSDNYAGAWARKSGTCRATRATGPLTKREQTAVAVGFAHTPDPTDISKLYALCGQSSLVGFYFLDRDYADPVDVRRVVGMLRLCPDNPLAEKLRDRIDDIKVYQGLEASHQIFEDGTYRVGKDVVPGTYYVKTGGDGCYWERTDAAGNIIDNNFTNGLRVEATIYSSDYSFTSTNCGEWRPVE